MNIVKMTRIVTFLQLIVLLLSEKIIHQIEGKSESDNKNFIR